MRNTKKKQSMPPWHTRVVLASMLVLAFAACTAQTPGAGTSDPDIPQVFTRTQQPADTRSGTLIERFSDDGFGSEIDPDSVRLLGTQGMFSFYAARRVSGDICLITMIDQSAGSPQPESTPVHLRAGGSSSVTAPPGAPTMGMGCNDPDQFAQIGEYLILESGRYDVAAVFFPDGYTDSVRAMFPDAFVRDNLLAFTSDKAIADAIDTHGSEVVLTGNEQDTLTIYLTTLK